MAPPQRPGQCQNVPAGPQWLVAPLNAHRTEGLEVSLRVKTPRATMGGTTFITSVIVRRLDVPAPMSPWNAPVALTIEKEDWTVAVVPGTEAELVSRMVTDPCAFVRVKASTVESCPDGPMSLSREPVT